MSETGEFVVQQPGFTGSVSELAHALRTGSLRPTELDLYQLVRSYLDYLQAYAADLEHASEALPRVAQVIELKLRLLLPKPPRLDPDVAEAEALEQSLEAVVLLEALEEAIDFLRRRRSERRLVLPARTDKPPYPRPHRPMRTSPTALANLASALRVGGYFELEPERVTLKSIMRDLFMAVRTRLSGGLFDLLHLRSWPERTIAFAALLELVKDGKVTAVQDEPFAPIQVSLVEGTSEDESVATAA